MPTIVKSRPWGKGRLSIGLDLERRQVISYYEVEGRTWGPEDLMEIPEGWPAERFDYLVNSWWSAFSANMGGDRFFEEHFGSEAADLAYGDWRAKAEIARRVIGSKEAGAIALDLIQAFYVEAPPGKTPFDNLAIVNKLQDLTFGKFNFDELLKFLNEALDRYWDIRTG
jgi:hypothetical protein